MRRIIASALVILSLPALASGQTARRGRTGIATGTGVTRPVPLPPTAPGISPMRAYTSSRLSSDAYIFGGTMHTDRLQTGTPSAALTQTLWGMGGRLDWRITDWASATGDMASSLSDGALSHNSVELGMRLKAVNEGRRSQPFFDIRGGWQVGYFGQSTGVGGSQVAAPLFSAGRGWASGFGSMAGAGFLYSLTQTFGIESEILVANGHMHGWATQQNATSPLSYNSRSVRFILGLKYTPRRLVALQPTYLKEKGSAP